MVSSTLKRKEVAPNMSGEEDRLGNGSDLSHHELSTAEQPQAEGRSTTLQTWRQRLPKLPPEQRKGTSASFWN